MTWQGGARYARDLSRHIHPETAEKRVDPRGFHAVNSASPYSESAADAHRGQRNVKVVLQVDAGVIGIHLSGDIDKAADKIHYQDRSAENSTAKSYR